MCGISGQFNFREDSTVDERNIVPMTAIIAHRGPDEWGYYIAPDRRAMLLHNRLSIIDLAGGKQPMSNEDGTIWVSFNGEIYGYRRLIRELTDRGHVFRTQSDTETIIHLYEEYGEDFVAHLRGEFAIALYDERKDELTLIRDRFGVKPLYYATPPGSVVFGSEIKAILAHSEVVGRLDIRSIYQYFCGFPLCGRTMFEGIHQVEPGEMLRVSRHGITRRSYWDISFATVEEESRIAASRSEGDLVEEFVNLLRESIELRLIADVDVGVYLSGGIDSSAVACLMGRSGREPFKAFTVGFEDHAYDESLIARQVAEANGMDFHQVRVGAGDLAAHFAGSIWHSEIPVPTSNGTAKFLLSRLARRHLKVVLTGEGSDELLCGYKQFKHQLLLEGLRKAPDDKQLRGEVRRFLRQSAGTPYVVPTESYREYDRVVGLFGNYPYTVLRNWQYASKMQWLFSAQARAEVGDPDPLPELAALLAPGRLGGLSPLAATQYCHFKTDLPAFLLNYLGDRQEMAHSIEGRTPFLDHKLVEFGCRLPTGMKIRDGVEKYALRKGVRGIVPGVMETVEKRLFLSPTSTTLGLRRRDSELGQYLSRGRIEDVGLFNPWVVKFIEMSHDLSGADSPSRRHYEAALTLVLSTQIIHDMFINNFQRHAARFAHPGAGRDLSSASVAVSRAPGERQCSGA